MTEEEQAALWNDNFPDEKLPGVGEPLPGKCGAKLRNKAAKDLGLERYCGKLAGMGTLHSGSGKCKLHGGSTQSHTRGAMTAKITTEIATMAAQLGEPTPLGPPEVEMFRLVSKMKTWSEILESQLDMLNGQLVVTDQAGIEHTRAMIEIMERGWDRLQNALSFVLKLDLQKRVVALEEQQARLVAAAFLGIILSQDLKLSEAQVNLARAMFAEEMSRLGPALVPTWAEGLVHDDEIIEAELV